MSHLSANVPISVILPLLENNKVTTSISTLVDFFADDKTLSRSSEQDLNHLSARVANYLRSNNTHQRWYGCKMASVLILNPRFMAFSGATYLTLLVKLLESRCFVRGQELTVQQKITLETICETICIFIHQIRGKPSLTREILTPRLASIIEAALEIVPLLPEASLVLLYDILVNNSTTFRPFGHKLNVKLCEILHSDRYLKMSKRGQSLVRTCFVTLKFQLARNEQSETYIKEMTCMISELKSVVALYKEFIKIDEDTDLMALLSVLPDSQDKDAEAVFPPLAIDVNEPLTVMLISDRATLLVELLISFFQAPVSGFSTKVPLGTLTKIAELLSTINVRFHPVKRELRDSELKSIVANSVLHLNRSGVDLFSALAQTFGKLMVSSLSSVFHCMELLVPTKDSNIADKGETHARKGLLLKSLRCCTLFLGMVSHYQDASPLIKMVESALILSEPTEVSSESEKISSAGNVGGKKTKRKSSKYTTSLSDLLSHKQLFSVKPSVRALATIREFLVVVVIRSVNLPTSARSMISGFAVRDILEHASNLKTGSDREIPFLRQLIHALVLHPGQEKFSLLPILTSVSGNSDPLLSLLVNPRLPVVATKATAQHLAVAEESDIEEVQEEVQKDEPGKAESKRADPYPEDEPEQKRLKLDETTLSALEAQKPQREVITHTEEKVLTFAPSRVEEAEPAVEVISKYETAVVEPTVVKPTVVKPAVTADPEENDNSDFEMPTIYVASDEE